ncbi:hypothetical protein ACSBLW_06595 [Thioclava sp. FR2]|uniref:hypothetical protein n=1 Tax=Thioclava sp. FR2 TaxID=3445780 RepID=UPI003EBFAEB8
MSRSLSVALIALMLLVNCGFVRDSKLNPFNWFGRSEPAEKVVIEKPKDPRYLVADVVSMNIETYSGGIIVRAKGITPTQGWWDAELVELEQDDPSHLVLEFRLLPPLTEADVNTPRSREIVVAKTVSPQRLGYITKITVQGANNARSSRAQR